MELIVLVFMSIKKILWHSFFVFILHDHFNTFFDPEKREEAYRAGTEYHVFIFFYSFPTIVYPTCHVYFNFAYFPIIRMKHVVHTKQSVSCKKRKGEMLACQSLFHATQYFNQRNILLAVSFIVHVRAALNS